MDSKGRTSTMRSYVLKNNGQKGLSFMYDIGNIYNAFHETYIMGVSL